jgi:hypothetical protein
MRSSIFPPLEAGDLPVLLEEDDDDGFWRWIFGAVAYAGSRILDKS